MNPVSTITGSTRSHISITYGQRVWKLQPWGMLTGLGISPVEMIFSGLAASSSSEITGIEDSSIWV